MNHVEDGTQIDHHKRGHSPLQRGIFLAHGGMSSGVLAHDAQHQQHAVDQHDGQGQSNGDPDILKGVVADIVSVVFILKYILLRVVHENDQRRVGLGGHGQDRGSHVVGEHGPDGPGDEGHGGGQPRRVAQRAVQHGCSRDRQVKPVDRIAHVTGRTGRLP